jgi:subtilisin family serine protease
MTLLERKLEINPALLAIIAFIAFAISPIYSQKITHEIIANGNFQVISRLINSPFLRSTSSDYSISIDTLSKKQELYLLTEINNNPLDQLISSLRDHGIRANNNYKIITRAVPNDEKLGQQWALENISIFDVWEETVGEFDYNNDRPVIAVIDNGFDLFHEDIIDNAFNNPGEIPDNNLDDDNNGYIDDYYGMFTLTENDSHPVEMHGTATAGIMAASGNNRKGISGVLWNTKILYISGIDSEAQVIKAYDYIYEMRKAYNESGGTKGAYVVCNNFSGGLDKAWGRDHVDWCTQYDRLGSLGILSVAAATNEALDIDREGDMPATCESPYLIVAHDVNESNRRANSGNSEKYVDIAAPGQEIISLAPDNAFQSFTGTSAASPHVAAAVVLLFTSPCANFYELSQSNPPQAALLVKEAILSGSEKLPALEGENVSQGKLNIFLALAQISTLCSEPLMPLNFDKITNNNGILTVEYLTDILDDHTLQIFDTAGKLWYTTTFKASLFGERSLEIPIYKLPTGIYYAQMSAGSVRVVKGIFLAN